RRSRLASDIARLEGGNECSVGDRQAEQSVPGGTREGGNCPSKRRSAARTATCRIERGRVAKKEAAVRSESGWRSANGGRSPPADAADRGAYLQPSTDCAEFDSRRCRQGARYLAGYDQRG